ncbi:condensation domain protein [Mycobacterium xenopi 3993]|nr:condensation domain protein [Mycobacterium xenopi 3993]
MDARACLDTLPVLSDEALAQARSQLDPAAGTMVRAVWAADTGELALVIHHLAVDAVSWRILVEDLNIAWASVTVAKQYPCRRAGRRLPGGRPCWPSARTMRRSWNRQARGSR